MERLTLKAINKPLPEGKKQIILRDSELPGFGIRISKQTKSWIVERRIQGINRRISVGNFNTMTLEAARREAAKIIGDISMGADPVAEKRNKEIAALTLREAMEEFLRRRNILESTKLSYRRRIEQHLGDWLDLPLREITKDMCEERHKALVGPTRCGTQGKARANGPFEVLRSIMLWAADRYLLDGKPLIASNPVDRLAQNRQWHRLQPRQGTIPDNQLADFYLAVMSQPKIASDFILFLLFSALRRGEAAKLKWTDIDYEKKTLTISLNKSGREHTLPLTQMLLAIIESRKGNNSEYVPGGRLDPKYLITEPEEFANVRQHNI